MTRDGRFPAAVNEVLIGQAGQDQEGFFEFYSASVLLRLRQD